MADDKTPLGGQEPTGDTTPPKTDLTLTEPATPPATDPGQEPKTYDEDYVKKLRAEAAEHRTKARDVQKQLDAQQEELDKARKAQEAKAADKLKEQGEFKALAEQYATRISELEPLEAKVERYETIITGMLENQREGLPEYVTQLLDKMDPVEQLSWLTENKARFSQQPAEPAQPRGLAGFNPATGQPAKETDAQRIARQRRQSGQRVSPFGSQN